MSGDKAVLAGAIQRAHAPDEPLSLQAFFTPEEISHATHWSASRRVHGIATACRVSSQFLKHFGNAVANFVNAIPMPGMVAQSSALLAMRRRPRNAGDVPGAVEAAVPTAPAPMPPSPGNAWLNELLLVGSAGMELRRDEATSAVLLFFARSFFLALLRVPSGVVFNGPAVGQNRVKPRDSPAMTKQIAMEIILYFPPRGIVRKTARR